MATFLGFSLYQLCKYLLSVFARNSPARRYTFHVLRDENSSPLIGILALQGDYDAHFRILSDLGARPQLVRAPDDLDGLQGLVIPGGESTVMSRLCDRYALTAPLKTRIEAGLPTFGTCAGLIFLAKHLEGASANFAQTTLGVLDATVTRNAYGAQADSFETDLFVTELGANIRAVFIRAPRIESVGEGVEVLARWRDEPVLVRQGAIVALAFHPEIAGENRVHGLWLDSFSPSRETPSRETPSRETPSRETPSRETPSRETPSR